MWNECSKCGKKEGLFIKLDKEGICESCHAEMWKENYNKEWENYKNEQESNNISYNIINHGEIVHNPNPNPNPYSLPVILKIYAMANGVCAILLGLRIASSSIVDYYDMGIEVFAIITGVGIAASLGIYAFGEAINLFQGIKNTISK